MIYALLKKVHNRQTAVIFGDELLSSLGFKELKSHKFGFEFSFPLANFNVTWSGVCTCPNLLLQPGRMKRGEKEELKNWRYWEERNGVARSVENLG